MNETLSLKDRMKAVADSFDASVPHRLVTRSFKPFDARKPAELEVGIYTLISNGEKGYKNFLGRRAKDGFHNMLLIGQIKVKSPYEGVDIDDAESDLVDEVKAWLQNLPLPLSTLAATGFRQSAQLDAPYGWVAFDLEIET